MHGPSFVAPSRAAVGGVEQETGDVPRKAAMTMSASVVNLADVERFETHSVSPFRAPLGVREIGRVALDDVAPGEIIDGIVGRSAALRTVLEDVEMVAPTDAAVLILGETGAGKEMIAPAVHTHSGRRAPPYVKSNLAAIPTGLLETHLLC